MRIPVYDEPQATPAAMPTVRQDARDYTGQAEQTAQFAQAAASAGTDLQRAAARTQDREDADALFRAEAGAVGDYQSSFEAPARERRGHNAIGLTNEAGQWWDKAGSKYAQNLTTERQRRLFGQRLQQLKQQSVDTMSSYESGQRRESLKDSTSAAIVGSINLAAANPGNEEILQSARDNIAKKVTVLGNINGEDEATRQVRLGEALTQLHGQVLQSLVDTNPTAARAYYDAHKAEIDGSKQAEIEKALKTGTLRTIAQGAADDLVDSRHLPMSAALAEARKKYSGDEEEAVVGEIKARFSEREASQNIAERDTADRAWKLYADAGQSKDAIPTSLWAALDGKTKLAIEHDYFEKLSGASTQTDWDVYDRLRTMARDEPAKFAKLDLRQYNPSLGRSERESLLDKQDQIAKGNDAATLEQQLAAVHNQMKWGESDKEKKGTFDTAVHQAMSDFEKTNGKLPNYDERQKIIDRLLMHNAGGFFGFGRKQLYQVQGTDAAKDFIPQISSDADYDKLESGQVFIAPDGSRRRKP